MPRRKILLVEDNPQDEYMVLRALKDVPVEILVARDGAEALKMTVGDDAETLDLILLDIKLPKYNGLQVLERIRQNGPTKLTPIVMLTSSDETDDVLASYSLGANGYVRKVEDLDSFMRTLRTMSQYWIMVNRSPSL